jgi:phosphoglycerate dehydrogenase-like enzyme
MEPIEIVALSPLSESDARRILDIDPRVRLTNAGDWFNREIVESWPAQIAQRLGQASDEPPRAERDAVLANAEIALLGFPYPMDLRARSPRLKWVHQRTAGANNLWEGDLWGSGIVATTSRGDMGGSVGAHAIAEYAIAGLLHVARDFGQAEADRRGGAFDRAQYRPYLLAGKTLCVVGVGGIGSIVGRLAAALGMRVVGIRHSVRADAPLLDGFSEILGPGSLLDALTRSDAVVVSCQLTKETENLMNATAFAALRRHAIVINVARGEIVQEDDLLDALDSRHLKGAVLDVYAGENEGPPPPRLWQHPKVLITPHNSPRVVGAPQSMGLGIAMFCHNLRAYLDGRPMTNVIDWARGY